MHTKSILSLLACAATLISAQDAGLTPDQTTAIEVAASTFEAGLMTQPAFSSLEELLATATTGPIATFLASLEGDLTALPTAAEPGFILSLASDVASGISLLPTPIQSFISEIEQEGAALLESVLSTTFGASPTGVSNSTGTMSSSSAGLKTSTKASNGSTSASTTGSASKTSASAITGATGAAEMLLVKGSMAGAVVLGAVMVML